MIFHQNKMLLLTILTIVLAVNTNSESNNPKAFVLLNHWTPDLQANTDSQTNNPKGFMLLNHWIPDSQNEMFNVNSNPGSRLTRIKRIGSLSIVNSLDVLRQQVLLELARRKAMQDQRQIDANRRFLETVGKRSVRPYNSDTAKDMSGGIRSGLEYSNEQGWLPDPVFREQNEEKVTY